MFVGCDHVMAGRDLRRRQTMYVPSGRRIQQNGRRFEVPTCRNPGRKQRFDFRGEIERFAVKCIEQRLDSETVTCGKQSAMCAVPNYKRKFTTQFVQGTALRDPRTDATRSRYLSEYAGYGRGAQDHAGLPST